jgi:hypothetical protein
MNEVVVVVKKRVFVKCTCSETARNDAVWNLGGFFLGHGATVPDGQSDLIVDRGLVVSARSMHDGCKTFEGKGRQQKERNHSEVVLGQHWV